MMDTSACSTSCRSDIKCVIKEQGVYPYEIKIDFGEYGVFETHFNRLNIYIKYISLEKYIINITKSKRTSPIDKKIYSPEDFINLIIKKLYNFVNDDGIRCYVFDKINDKVIHKKIKNESEYELVDISAINYGGTSHNNLFLLCIKNLGIYNCTNGLDAYDEIRKIDVTESTYFIKLKHGVFIPGGEYGDNTLLPCYGYTYEFIINAFRKLLSEFKKLPVLEDIVPPVILPRRNAFGPYEGTGHWNNISFNGEPRFGRPEPNKPRLVYAKFNSKTGSYETTYH